MNVVLIEMERVKMLVEDKGTPLDKLWTITKKGSTLQLLGLWSPDWTQQSTILLSN